MPKDHSQNENSRYLLFIMNSVLYVYMPKLYVMECELYAWGSLRLDEDQTKGEKEKELGNSLPCPQQVFSK